MSKNPDLAIVIPACKAAFFRECLSSVFRQTDRRFNLYIGDDAGPPELEAAAGSFSFRPGSLHYHRFPENLGRSSLVKQWERCIALTRGERYIWLFGDDDRMDPGCVARFYETLAATGGAFDLYRFNKLVIDAKGDILSIAPPHPPEESSIEFAYHLLNNVRSCTASEYIFSRAAYDTHGGFVDFPLAWGSDWCTWLLYGEAKGIRLIPDAYVRFRSSGANLTSAPGFRREKIAALLQYSRWIRDFFQDKPMPELGLDANRLMGLQRENFFSAIGRKIGGVPPGLLLPVAREAAELWNGSPVRFMLRILAANGRALRRRYRRIYSPL